MSAHRLTTHTTTYAPWEDGADERKQTGTRSEDWDCTPDPDRDEHSPMDAAVRVLRDDLHCTSPSTWPHCQPGTIWYAEPDPYEHPYTGELTEVTAHLHGFTDAEERAVYTRLTDPKAGR